MGVVPYVNELSQSKIHLPWRLDMDNSICGMRVQPIEALVAGDPNCAGYSVCMVVYNDIQMSMNMHVKRFGRSAFDTINSCVGWISLIIIRRIGDFVGSHY